MRRRLAIVLAAMTLCACTSEQPAPEVAAPDSIQAAPETRPAEKRKKRFRKLPDVQPVSHSGVRYGALHWGKERDLGQNGGYVVAFDEKSGEELWLQKIYDVVYDNEMESDKQDVFITELALDANGEELLIANEHGKRFSMRLSDRRVLDR